MKNTNKKVPYPNNLALYRKRRGYSPKDVAEILDVSVVTVTNWEKGIQLPNIFNFFGLGHLYRVESTQLYRPYVRQLDAELNKGEKRLLDNRKSGRQ